MRMLEQAAELGLDILHEVRRRALAHGAVSPAEAAQTLAPEGDLGLVYPRIQRAIRQAVALHARLEAEFHVRAAEEAQRIAAAPPAIDPAAERRERAVKRAVTKAIERGDYDLNCRGDFNLLEDLDDRMDEFDDLDDDGQRPIGAVVESLCKVLGLQFDPALWEHEPWAIEEIKTKPAGSPYLAWPTQDDWPDPDLEQDDGNDPFGLTEEASTRTGPP